MERIIRVQRGPIEYLDKPQKSQLYSYLSSPHFNMSLIKSESTSSFGGDNQSPARISIKEKNWKDRHDPDIIGKHGVRIYSPNRKFVSRQFSENHTLGTINSEESTVIMSPPKPILNSIKGEEILDTLYDKGFFKSNRENLKSLEDHHHSF